MVQRSGINFCEIDSPKLTRTTVVGVCYLTSMRHSTRYEVLEVCYAQNGGE